MVIRSDTFGYIEGINHIGLTVPNIEDATKFFKEGLDGKIAYDSQKKMKAQ